MKKDLNLYQQIIKPFNISYKKEWCLIMEKFIDKIKGNVKEYFDGDALMAHNVDSIYKKRLY